MRRFGELRYWWGSGTSLLWILSELPDVIERGKGQTKFILAARRGIFGLDGPVGAFSWREVSTY